MIDIVVKEEEKVIRLLVEEIIRNIHPLSIWLFGSALSGTMNDDSDIDLLVVIPEGIHKRRTAQSLYKRIRGIGRAFDLIVATEKDLEKHRQNPGLIYKSILEQGKQVYAA